MRFQFCCLDAHKQPMISTRIVPLINQSHRYFFLVFLPSLRRIDVSFGSSFRLCCRIFYLFMKVVSSIWQIWSTWSPQFTPIINFSSALSVTNVCWSKFVCRTFVKLRSNRKRRRKRREKKTFLKTVSIEFQCLAENKCLPQSTTNQSQTRTAKITFFHPKFGNVLEFFTKKEISSISIELFLFVLSTFNQFWHFSFDRREQRNFPLSLFDAMPLTEIWRPSGRRNWTSKI